LLLWAREALPVLSRLFRRPARGLQPSRRYRLESVERAGLRFKRECAVWDDTAPTALERAATSPSAAWPGAWISRRAALNRV